MDMRLLAKLLLWSMLTLSCLGTISTIWRIETEPTPTLLQRTMEQQMAIQTALGFSREWMYWDGEELPEARMQRLKPYVNPDALVRISTLQLEQKANRQQVISTDFVSFSSSVGANHTIRIRVIALNPKRVMWEIDVPVWVQVDKGAAVTVPPTILPLKEPPTVPEVKSVEAESSTELKQRMRPAIESFLKAMCEGEDADSLYNYVTTDAKLTPLNGRLRFLALEKLEATGEGPYSVAVTFSVQDEATSFRFTQLWTLTVTEENQKFFVRAVQ